ncbi:MAG: beta-ketoacyl-ACP synthase II [Thermomicrobiales bacterium]|nr:beta-ketoacyl-ACP synthase II [Thermomicrobiales bacterium]
MAPEGRTRVVITGIGIVSPLGLGREATWAGLVAGRSGVSAIERFDASALTTRFAGQIREFDPAAVMGRKEARRADRYTQFAVAATREALEHSGLTIDEGNADRVGAIVASGMGGIATLEQGAATLMNEGPHRVSPFFMTMFLPNMASGVVAMTFGARGPNFAPVSACASSAHALGEAAEMIRRGWADAMLASGAEAAVSPLSIAGFNAMGALSTRNDAPEKASRPFDAEREGFVLGEGAATLVLESLAHARARGAVILAELAGYGTTDDANHVVQPAPGGIGAAKAMRLALVDAGLRPGDIDYLNAHGTSTQLNEKFETQALKAAFGEAAATLPVSGTKSMTGHLLGAAGALEGAISVLAIQRGIAPPTINQETADPDCDLDYVPNMARDIEIRHAMSNSMGFGGHNVSLIFSAFAE